MTDWTFEPPEQPLRFNNAAGRLLELLSVLEQQKQFRTDVAWRVALGLLSTAAAPNANGHAINEYEWRNLFEMLSSLHTIVDQIEQEIEDSLDDKDLYTHILPSLRKLLSPLNMNESLEAQIYLIKTVMTGLAHCAKDLPKDGVIEPDELKSLFDAVSELFEQIRQSDIPAHLKRWMLNLLDTILKALNFYRINGSKGLRDALVKFIGELAIRGQELKQSDKVPQGIKDRFFGVVTQLYKIVKVISAIQSTAKLIGWGAKMLELELEPSPELEPPQE